MSGTNNSLTSPTLKTSGFPLATNEWQNCLGIAKRMFKGTFTPLSIRHPSGEYVYPDHFLQAKLMRSKRCPYWAKGQWHKKVDDLCFLVLGKFRTTKD